MHPGSLPPDQKSCFPRPRWFTGDMVSVLDLDWIAAVRDHGAARPGDWSRCSPTRGRTGNPVVSLSERCQSRLWRGVQADGRRVGDPPAIGLGMGLVERVAPKGRKPKNRYGHHANDVKMVERSGIEPLTPCLQSRCSPG